MKELFDVTVLVQLLKDNNLTISFGESCTGGLLASTIVSVSGASNVLKESYITYSNEAKQKILQVKKETIDLYSVYSKEVAKEMAIGLENITKSNINVSVTGQTDGSDVCYCDYCIKINEEIYLERVGFSGSRNEVRMKQVNHILSRVYKILTDYIG